MPGGTIITNTAQSDPEGFKSSLDWNQEIPLENKVNDHQIKSRAREIYTRIKAGVKNADEADKILNQFSEQLDRSSGWFAKGCLRLTYSDDLRRDLVIKRKYGIQILWQDDRNHEFYVAMHALLEVKGVDKQVLDRIHQPGRATISQMRTLLQEVKRSQTLRLPSFAKTKESVEAFLQYQESYDDIMYPCSRISEILTAIQGDTEKKGPLEINDFMVQRCQVYRDESFSKHYEKRKHKTSVESFTLDLYSRNEDQEIISAMEKEATTIKDEILKLSINYSKLFQDISHYSVGSVHHEVLSNHIACALNLKQDIMEMKMKIDLFLSLYQDANLVQER